MANTKTLRDQEPVYFETGSGPIQEWDLNIDTINTNVEVFTPQATKRVFVVGLLLNNVGTSVNVTLTSGSSAKARVLSLTKNQQQSGYLFATNIGEAINIKSDTTAASILVRIVEADRLNGESAMSFGTSSAGGGGTTTIGDGTNTVEIDTANANAESNTDDRLPVNARLATFNGTTWDGVVSGKTGAQSAYTGMVNTLPVAKYNATPLSLSDGQGSERQCDSTGVEKVNPGIYTSTPVESSVSVTTSTTVLMAANANRTGAIIQNTDATNYIRIAKDGGSAVDDGTCLKVLAGETVFLTPPFCGAVQISAIANTATCTVHVTEHS